MDRRHLLKAAALPAAATGLAAPALAQARPKVSWRLTSSFPRNLDTLYGAATTFARMVGEATDGDFTIRILSPGEIVPALEAREATSKGFVESCLTASSYSIGTEPGLHVWHSAAVRTEQPPADGVSVRDGRQRQAEPPSLREAQRALLAADQHRCADGRVVPQGS